MPDSTTDTRDRLRRWRTPIVSAAVAGGLLLGGYGIAAAADSGSSTPDGGESAPSAPESTAPDQGRPDQARPDQAQPGQPGEGHGGAGCDEAPAESSATT
ncbi:hypothetical protein [Jiangella muralis]|uniref:hypothetical protein n=1 Tax=Jiangella muralis TaxID=702383 RepID=UPI00069CDA27|nr:hypothetical protein [Jiangella muralis]